MSNLGQGILEQGIEEGLLKSGMARVLDQECGSRQEDLRLLRKMIAEQNALGARMPEDMDSEQYVWKAVGPSDHLTASNKESPHSSQNGSPLVARLTELHLENRKLRGTLSVSGFGCLKLLNCSGNELEGLTVSGNPALKSLFCWNNRLTELDVSDCPSLRHLDCSDNRLTELDTKPCPVLMELDCPDNELPALDLSENRLLVSLCCTGNPIASLDIRNNPVLGHIVYDRGMEINRAVL